MNTMKWLVKREFWENKGIYLWTPLILAGLSALMYAGLVLFAFPHAHNLNISQEAGANVQVNISMLSFIEKELATTGKSSALEAAASMYWVFMGILPLLLAFSSLIYLSAAMHSERNDRSVLFWKSLPISDLQTVLSKLALPFALGPLLIFLIAIGLYIVLALLFCLIALLNGVNLFPWLLFRADLMLFPLKLLVALPTYALWALPTAAWFLLVSSWAKSRVFLWAVGLPIAGLIFLKLISHYAGIDLNVQWVFKNIVARLLGGTFPGAWIIDVRMPKELEAAFSFQTIFEQMLLTLQSPALWIGVIAGGGMLYVAARMRRYREDF